MVHTPQTRFRQALNVRQPQVFLPLELDSYVPVRDTGILWIMLILTLKQTSQDTRTVDDMMIQVVYYYLPAEVGTAEVTTCAITYTLRCQDSHNPQCSNTPIRYVTVKLKRQKRYPP